MGFLHHGQTDSKQNTENDDLQYLAFCNRFGDVFRKNMQHGFFPPLRRRHVDFFRLGCCRHIDPNPRFAEVDREEPDEQGNCGNHFEVHNGFPTHTPYLFQICMARNTDYQGSENQRCNDGFDQVEENLTHDFQLLRHRWEIVANFRPDYHTEQDPGCLALAQVTGVRQQTDGHPAKKGRHHHRQGRPTGTLY